MTPVVAAADWGTTAFRLWLLAGDGAVVAERRSDEGLMAARGAGGFEAVLERHLGALGASPSLPVVLCGMVGARSGWVEAAYLDAPLPLQEVGTRSTPVPGLRRAVSILPGIAQRAPGRPDVMRGEETKLLGAGLADGLVVMPGTHSKWAAIGGGTLREFATFMSGEIFAALSEGERSVLREALASGGQPDGFDEAAFDAGVADALAAPALALNQLFALRAAWLLEGRTAREGRARLSGLLIGLECAGARERFGLGAPATIVAAPQAAARHARAMALAGWPTPAVLDADTAVRAGLLAAFRLGAASRDAEPGCAA